MRQIVTCTGHGGTGSSFITDFFKEFENPKIRNYHPIHD